MKKASEIFDTHAHLCDAAFDDEREAIIADLGAHGVGAFTEIGFDLPSSRAALALAERYPQVYAAVGFHPDHSDHLRDEDVETLRQMVENNQKIVAIGEIGMDYHYTREGILRRAAASGQEPDP